MKFKYLLVTFYFIAIFIGCIGNSKKKENKFSTINDTVFKKSISKKTIKTTSNFDSITNLDHKKSKTKIDLKVLIEGKTYYKKNAGDTLFIMQTSGYNGYSEDYKNMEKYSYINTKNRKTYDITTGKYYRLIQLGHPYPHISDENNLLNGFNLNHEDIKPSYPGGIEKLQNFISENYKIPTGFIESSSNSVVVSFVVEQDGELTDIKVIRDLGYGTGKEAIRIMKLCQNWNSAKKNGEKVRVLFCINININNAEIKVNYGWK